MSRIGSGSWRRGSCLLASAMALVGCGGPEQISRSGLGAYEASLDAFHDGGFAVAWYDSRDGNAEIYARLLDSRGRAVSKERRLTQTMSESYEADLALLGQRVAVAWYEKEAGGRLHASLALFDSSLEPLWRRELGADGRPSRNPVVRAFGDALFTAWIERISPSEEVVRALWLGADGSVRGPVWTLGRASATTWNLNAALSSHGAAFVTYDARVETIAEELFLAELDADGPRVARITADDGAPSKYPDIAFGTEDTLALTWFDERDGNQEVYVAVGPLDALERDAFSRALRVTNTPGHSIGAYLAWNRDRLGLVWCDDSVGAHEIYFATFSSGAHLLGAPRRLTHSATSSLIPAIVAAGDGFALAWNEAALGPNGMHDPETRSEVLFDLVR
jgi:hypothetical protein